MMNILNHENYYGENEKKELWRKEFLVKEPKEIAKFIERKANGSQQLYLNEIGQILKNTKEFITSGKLDDEEILRYVDKISEICKNFNLQYGDKKGLTKLCDLAKETPLQGNANIPLGYGILQDIIFESALNVKDDKIRENLIARLEKGELSSNNYLQISRSFKNENKKIEYIGYALKCEKDDKNIDFQEIETIIESIQDPINLSNAEGLFSKIQINKIREIQKAKLLDKLIIREKEVSDGEKIIVDIKMNEDNKPILKVLYDFGNGLQSSKEMNETAKRKAETLYKKAYNLKDNNNIYIEGDEEPGAKGCEQILHRLESVVFYNNIPIYIIDKSNSFIKYNQFENGYLNEADYARNYSHNLVKNMIDELEINGGKENTEIEKIRKDFIEKSSEELAINIAEQSNRDSDLYIKKIGKMMEVVETYITSGNVNDEEMIEYVNKLGKFCKCLDAEYGDDEMFTLIYDSPLEGDDTYQIGGRKLYDITMQVACNLNNDNLREELISRYKVNEIASNDHIELAKAFKDEDKKIKYFGYAIDYEMNEGDLSIENISILISSIQDQVKRAIAQELLDKEQLESLELYRKNELIEKIKRAQRESDDLDKKIKSERYNQINKQY